MTRTALVRTDRYSWGAIWLHWAIAVLVIANLALGLLHESLLEDIKAVIPAHQAIGITVLALGIARIGWRLTRRPPPLPPGIARWEHVAAKAAHAAFYALLVGLPLSGWMLSSDPERLRPLTWFGLSSIPYLPVPTAAAQVAGDVHRLLGWLMAALVVMHVAAVMRHHLVLRDAVLARMAPGLARNG